MIDVEVGEYEQREIDAQIDRVLRDLGNPAPPLQLPEVRRLLKLDLQYYQSTDPGLLTELTHQFTLLARKTIPDIGKHLSAALQKSKLTAFWVPADKKILLDQTVPKPKHRWIESHEICHSLTDWHRSFLLGDNDATVDPICHATIEAEANYGAGRLLFLGQRFPSEARDMTLSFNSIKQLSDRYKNTITSTFWRMIEIRDPTLPCFGIVSGHPRYPEIGKHDGADPWRYFIRSAAFRRQFGNILPAEAYSLVVKHVTGRQRGPIFEANDELRNAIGERWEFNVEAFCNSHALLTLGYAKRKL